MKEETAGHPGVVGGVDTHKDLHMAAVVDEHDRVLGSECFATTRHGYRQMLAWMRSFGELLRVGVECTGTYGAGLLRYLQHAEVTVLEVTAPDRSDRRKRGKDDTLDAENAAHAAFAGVRTVTPRTRDGMIESLRVLKVCRKTAVAARRVALQLIHNTVVCAPDELRESLRTMTRMQLIRTLAAWRPDLSDYRNLTSAYRITLKSLGRRYLELHDGFAALCGVSPVPASSGKVTRHRLNRGGDRAANSALHIIAIGRLRTDPHTKAYVDRRVSEGHSKLEAIRCLKRYIAREVYYVIRKRNRQIGQVQVAWKRPVPDNRQAFVI